MVWSPRQLADLAGTSRRAVRHYQELGLLPEPERQSNGYQLYSVEHLLRLLRIRRLTDLGLTLPQVAAVGDADRPPVDVLRAVDVVLAGRAEQIQRTRAELAEMLERAAPAEVPAELVGRVVDLPAAERALVVVLTRLLSPAGVDAYLEMLDPYRGHAAVVAFDHLPDEADEATRGTVTAALVDHVRQLTARRPDEIATIDRDLARGPSPRRRVVDQAVRALYNPAQRDVLGRTARLSGRSRPMLG